jgi:hypothetical protein
MPLFSCPHCGRQGNARPRASAAQVRCRGCNQSFVIPATQGPAPAPPPAQFPDLRGEPQPPPGPGGVASFFWLLVALIAGGTVAVMVFLGGKVLADGAPPAALLLVPLNPVVVALLVLLAPCFALAVAIDRMSR